jgi:hypothetical protein
MRIQHRTDNGTFVRQRNQLIHCHRHVSERAQIENLAMKISQRPVGHWPV